MAPLTSKGKSWEFANSLWMIWAWLPMLGFISFLYIGVRVKQRKWLVWSAVYFIPWILTFVVPHTNDSEIHWTDNVWVASIFLAWFGSAFHVFRVRKEYLLRRAAMEQLNWRDAQELKNQIEMEYNVDLDKPLAKAAEEKPKTPPKTVEAPAKPVNAPRQRVLNNEEDPTIATRITTATTGLSTSSRTADEEQSGPTPDLVESHDLPDHPEEEPLAASKPIPTPPAEPIDLNKATEAELALLPGVGEILAKRAVSEREVRGGFRSVEEFVTAIGLRPELVERIRPFAYIA